MREEIAGLPRMKKCMLSGMSRLYGRCDTGKPDWHHVWTYAGRQINEPWAILPACRYHHAFVSIQPAIRDAFEHASLLIATDEELERYPKKPWAQIKRSLGIKT